MSIYQDTVRDKCADPPVFAEGVDPIGAFAQLRVHVAFDSDRPSRRPVEQAVVGYTGRWVCAYSSAEALRRAQQGEEVEYSLMKGQRLLQLLPAGVGLWFEYGHPNGRPILLPQPNSL